MTIQQFTAGQTLTAAQMNTLQSSDFNYSINVQSGTSYTLVADDFGKMIRFTNSGSITLTIPPSSSVSFDVGDEILILLDSIGTLTVTGGSGVTVNSEGNITTLVSRYSIARLIKLDTDSWILTGILMNSIPDETITNSDISPTAAIALSKLADTVIETKTANYALVLGDKDKIIEMNVGSPNTVTIPTNLAAPFPIGAQITIVQLGSGKTQIVVADPTFMLLRRTPGPYLRDQYSSASLIKRGTDEWLLIGDLSVS